MSNTNAKILTRPTRATVAPDYAVPDPQEAWERFDRLVRKVLDVPKQEKQPEAQSSFCPLLPSAKEVEQRIS